MPDPYLLLTTPSGNDITDPSSADLTSAIQELRTGKTGQDTTFLRCGSKEGTTFTLEVDRDGAVSFTEFLNPEDDDPIVELTGQVSLDQALQLWTWLSEGALDNVKSALAEEEKPQ